MQVVSKILGADTLDIERGIDAADNLGEPTNAIQIMWFTHTAQRDLEKFNIYRSKDESGLVLFNPIASKEIGQPGLIDTVFNDTQDLVLNRRYYYFVTAVDKDGQESENSDTLSYMLLEKPEQLSLNGNSQLVVNPVMDFKWQSLESHFFYLRVEARITEDFHPLVYFRKIRSAYGDGWQDHHLEGEWLKSVFENGNYRWRVDCEGVEEIDQQRFSGSESDWSFFEVNWSN